MIIPVAVLLIDGHYSTQMVSNPNALLTFYAQSTENIPSASSCLAKTPRDVVGKFRDVPFVVSSLVPFVSGAPPSVRFLTFNTGPANWGGGGGGGGGGCEREGNSAL